MINPHYQDVLDAALEVLACQQEAINAKANVPHPDNRHWDEDDRVREAEQQFEVAFEAAVREVVQRYLDTTVREVIQQHQALSTLLKGPT